MTSLTAAVDTIARWRVVLLSLFTVAVSTLGLLRPNCDSDVLLFARAGHQLLTGHWSSVYADLANQGGPLELLWNAAATAGAASCPGPLWALPAGLLASLLVVALSVAAVRLAAPGPGSPTRARVELLCGVVAAMTSAPWTLKWGHPADVVIPLAWVAAAALLGRGRWVSAGLLLGAAAGFETWAVLGLPVLLVARWRHGLAAAVTAGVVALTWYLPFLATGHFAMFDMSWDVWPSSLLGVITGAPFETWPMRLGQAVLVLAGGCAVVLASRRTRHAGWLLAVAAGGLRLLTDPVLWPYYWVLVTVPALVGVAFLVVGDTPRRARRSGLVALALVLAPHPPAPWAYLPLVAALVALALTVRALAREGRREPSPWRDGRRWGAPDRDRVAP